MRKMVTLAAATPLVLSLMVTPGIAHEEMEGSHGHLFIHEPVFEYLVDGPDGSGVYATGFRKCIDLPEVPLNAHHASLHTGTAGEALGERAGHAVVPTAPLTPWATCAELADDLPIRVG